MTRSAQLYALVPCAGSGSRAASPLPKQYVEVAGAPLVAHPLKALGAVSRLRATLVVLAPDDDGFEQRVPDFVSPRGWLARCGGTTRAATVAAGLAELRRRGATDEDWVLVHDAARALLQPAWVDRLIDACLDDAVGGLLALPVADTLKEEAARPTSAPARASGEGAVPSGSGVGVAPRVATTLDRRGKWAAQTPQMFRLGLLQRALGAAGNAVTDESSAVEALGLQPRLVPGPMENFKVTWPEDFDMARRLLDGRSDSTSLRPHAARAIEGGVSHRLAGGG
jgi:2-C-methyl-D-erythritol 4-phosphate cytidylyltransferase/2-C-methyl-D-erythritol 4-phosphate cytidylyltransferase/2-C-methyl-D-erythritol 2,4-cyclodiphosphate synthase